MRALIVYESMFGNTKQVAQAAAEGLTASLDATAVEVSDAPSVIPDDVTMLVVGGPTHAFGMSRESSRRDAQKQSESPLISQGLGVRDWIEQLPSSSGDTRVAVFDTHTDKKWIPGSAARAAHKALRHKGYHLVAPPTSFYVSGTTGPLVTGELDRARAWGRSLGSSVTV